ncbi:MAG: 23S rRNA (guanosine(2251)-2'-O)-methyltransferase RlmB [Deltaproteobacteria bacterium]|nr:23S rRNA (guanosine(2251)-2'-O)-methyltransferase RlmB [Deltaproteobacteria bacterium]
MPGPDLMHEIIYGIHPVSEALNAEKRKFYRIYVSCRKDNERKDNRRITAIENMAEKAGIPIETIPDSRLSTITTHAVHQGIAAETSPFRLVGLDEMLHEALHGIRSVSKNQTPFILMADSISDAGNLGALIRTSVCAGLTGIIIPKNRSARPSPAVSKASAGAMEHALICRATNLSDTMKILKKNGFWIVGLDRDADMAIYEADMTGPTALVIGGEDTGIRPLVLRNCDLSCNIPQTGPVNSLNASVAAAVAIYETIRQKTLKG